MELISAILRIVLLSLSFFGLCASARCTLRLNRFIAPCFVACSVICVLMFGGMLRVLKYTFFLLYFGGFGGFIYTYIIRRIKPDWLLIGLFCVFAAYLAWRFHDSELFIADDFSHWGTAAQHVLTRDTFPDDSAPYIFFQSYPLGSTVWIYYVCRSLGNSEPLWLIAQNLLQAMLFLPTFALIRRNHRFTVPVVSALFLILFKFNRPFATLTVDWLLAFFGTGLFACILFHQSDLRKAAAVVLPGMIAVTFIKSSGVFFAALLAVVLTALAWHGDRKAALRIFILSSAAIIVASLAWTMHVKLSFSAGFDTKHAVSITAYLQKLQTKSLIGCLSIGWKMIRMLLKPEYYQIFGVLFLGLSFAFVHMLSRNRPELDALRRRAIRRLACCLLCYAVWFAMLYAMYVFSMPASEANRLASFSRYDSTGILLMTGLALSVMLDFLNQIDLQPVRPVAIISLLLCVGLLGSAPLLSLGREYGIYNYFYSDLFNGVEAVHPMRKYLREVCLDQQPDPEKTYLIYCDTDNGQSPSASSYYAARFELNALRLGMLYRTDSENGSYTYGNTRSQEPIESLTSFLSEHLADFDILLILKEDPDFETELSAALASFAGNTAVLRAY